MSTTPPPATSSPPTGTSTGAPATTTPTGTAPAGTTPPAAAGATGTTTPPAPGSPAAATAPTPATAVAGTPVNKEVLNSGLFDDQAFLIYNITKLAPIHRNIHRDSGQTYKKLDLLKGPNVAVINQILNADFTKKQPILTLTPAQISELVPQVRLFKQYLGADLLVSKEIEFLFDAYLGANSVLEGKDLGRSSYGFKSLEIESQGTTDFESDKMFTGRMQLYFQNLDELVKTRNSSYTFLDLLIHPKVGGPPPPTSATDAAAPVSSLPSRTDTSSAFRIRIEVGWSAGSFNTQSAFAGDSKTVLEAIRQTKMSFIMSPTIHNLNINDDGTVTLDIEFIGSFDRIIRELRSGIVLTKDLRTKLEEKSKALKAAADTGNAEAIKKARDEFAGMQTVVTKEGFESIIKELMEPEDKKSRVFQTIISREAMNQFGALNSPVTPPAATTAPAAGGTTQPAAPGAANAPATTPTPGVQTPPPTPPAPAPAAPTPPAPATPAGTAGTPAAGTPAAGTTAAGTPAAGDAAAAGATTTPAAPPVVLPTASPVKFCELSWKPSTIEDQGFTYNVFDPIQEAEGNATIDSFKNSPIVKDSFGREYHNLSWIYLGDLLEVIMNRAYAEDGGDAATLRRFGSGFSKRVKILLTDIEIVDYCDGKPKRLNLAHVPISLKKFTVFFYNNVINTRNIDYTVDDFVKALINDLLEDVFLRRNYIANSAYKQDVKIKYMNLAVFSTAAGVDPLRPNGDVVRTNMISGRNMVKSSGPDINPNNFFFYLVLYQDIFDPAKLKGSYASDQSRGIPHIYMGRDLGILKKTTFTKNQISGQREERIRKLGASFDPALVLMSLYDINLQMYGNTMFLPGKYLYLVPTGMGPLIGLPNDPNSYSNLMGLGGYYLVTKVNWAVESGVYATTVIGKHEYTGGGRLANKQLYARDAGTGITDQ